jgi:hypothetical protein
LSQHLFAIMFQQNKRTDGGPVKQLLLLVLVASVYCEDYINVRLNTGYESAALNDLSKITFDGTNINFVLSSGTTSRAHTNVEVMEFTTTASDVSLPVELVSFTAFQKHNMVLLSWETASEVENFGFDIERTYSGRDAWKRLDFVEGNGSVTRTSNYTFLDKSLDKKSNVKYRLKQIDYDGSYEYSAAVSVVYNEHLLPERDKLYSNYPNPFNPLTTIRYEINCDTHVRLAIYDTMGKEVAELVNNRHGPGSYEVSFDGGQLSSGVYIGKIHSNEYSKVIKMLLVK